MPSYWLQGPRGNRILIAAPVSVAEHKLVSGPLADYQRLTAATTEVRDQLADVEKRIAAAEAKHVQALGVAIATGTKEPSPPATVKLDATKLELGRRRAAIPAALDQAEGELVEAIEAARVDLLGESAARLVDARERARLALDELGDARVAMMAERGLAGWLTSFPQGAGRPPGSGTPAVRELLGLSGEAIGFGVVLAALRADIDPTELGVYQPGAAA